MLGLKSFAFEGGLVLWDRGGSRLMAFNAATAEIWPKIEAGRSPRQIAAGLARRYGLPLERARKDVDVLVAELSRLDVLVGATSVADAEHGALPPARSSSPPLGQLTIKLAGLRLSIEAEAGIIAFLRPLFHGRISVDDKVDCSICSCSKHCIRTSIGWRGSMPLPSHAATQPCCFRHPPAAARVCW